MCRPLLLVFPQTLREGLVLGERCRHRLPQGLDQLQALPAAQPVAICLLVSGPVSLLSGLLSLSCHKLSSPRQATRDRHPLLKGGSCLRLSLWEPRLIQQEVGRSRGRGVAYEGSLGSSV